MTNKKLATTLAWQKVNEKQYKQYQKEYRSSHKQEQKLAAKQWDQSNKEQAQNNRRTWKQSNKERVKIIDKKWATTNRGKAAAKTRKYQASRLERTPKWLTKEQLKEIEEYYLLVEELQWLSDPSDPLEVDHIVPLQGKNVSGLHVPWNLQILPKSLNSSKSNNYLTDSIIYDKGIKRGKKNSSNR